MLDMATVGLSGDEVRAILAQYALGELVGFTVLPLDAYNAPYYRVKTTSGHYFLKRYKAFTEHVDRGLDLIALLRRRSYPAIEVMLSRSGAPHVGHRGAEVALFEYLELPEGDWALPPRRAFTLGEALGRLHALAQGFLLPDAFLSHGELLRRLRSIPAARWHTAEMRETLAYVANAFPALGVPADQPRGACHVEFGLEHVRFAGDAVLRVIDWDLVGADHLLYDLGTTLSEGVHTAGVDFAAVAAIVRGYDAQRPLTEWERAHLYEAACFGACKYLIWEHDSQWAETHGVSPDSFKKVDTLRALGKAAFDAGCVAAAGAA